MDFFHNVFVIFATLFTKGILGERTGFCNGESFQPSCDAGQVIIMKSALYGRMNLGRCIPEDLGYLGCSSDVLSMFDATCSGKQTCEVFVTDSHIKVTDGCRRGISRYLEVDFECRRVTDIRAQCPSSDIKLNSDDSLITGSDIHLCALGDSRKVMISAGEGQHINISIISFSKSKDEIFGSVKDTKNGNNFIFGSGARNQHLMTSSSNIVEVLVQSSRDSGKFMMHFQVYGCPNVSPPNGAWMTRNVNVMEIGCHSSSKSWTMKCEHNQWIGAVGQCGSAEGKEVEDQMYIEKAVQEDISMNVIMFGGSSVIILISAVIFLIGVCILRRKLQPAVQQSSDLFQNETGNNRQDLTLLLGHGNDSYPNQNQSSSAIQGYKSLQIRESGRHANDTTMSPPAYTMYANTNGSDNSGSVQYFVLEDQQPTTA